MDDQLNSIAKIVIEYYKQSDRLETTQADFDLWINSLEEPIKSNFKNKGLKGSRSILNFQRFILELRDIGLDEYLKENLTSQAYQLWKAQEVK